MSRQRAARSSQAFHQATDTKRARRGKAQPEPESCERSPETTPSPAQEPATLWPLLAAQVGPMSHPALTLRPMQRGRRDARPPGVEPRGPTLPSPVRGAAGSGVATPRARALRRPKASLLGPPPWADRHLRPARGSPLQRRRRTNTPAVGPRRDSRQPPGPRSSAGSGGPEPEWLREHVQRHYPAPPLRSAERRPGPAYDRRRADRRATQPAQRAEHPRQVRRPADRRPGGPPLREP